MELASESVAFAVEQTVLQLAEANRRAADLLVLYETLLSQRSVAFACWDENLRCLRTNISLAGVAGFTGSSCRGRSMGEMLPSISSQLEPLCREVLQSGQPRIGVEITEQVATGTPRCWLVGIYPVTIVELARPIHAVGVTLTETTVLQQREHKLMDARDAAVAAQHEAQEASVRKSHALEWVSHELRRPLTPVLMELSLLLEDPATGHVLRDSLEMMVRNLTLQAKLIEDLVDATRLNQSKITLRLEPVNMHDLIRQAVEISVAEVTAKRLQVSLDLSAEFPVVKGDPRRLLQVLWNLINNATKFTPPAGSVWIRSRNTTMGVPGSRPPELLIDIQDTGQGIEPADLEKVFWPFEQAGTATEQRSGGLGLGLTLGRSLAELHGGTLVALSEGKGRGSTFRLTLPILSTPS